MNHLGKFVPGMLRLDAGLRLSPSTPIPFVPTFYPCRFFALSPCCYLAG